MKLFPALVSSALAATAFTEAKPYLNMRGAAIGQPRELADEADLGYIKTLKKIENSDAYHMKPVRVIHVRAQSDAPAWDAENKMFTSRYGTTFDSRFRAALDTVNTASVEGGLMYVQAECINYNTRSAEARCQRKNNVQYMVFYDIVMTQTNETLALYTDEYGPMLPMDGGRCTPSSVKDGKEEFPKECYYFNGDNGQPKVGPFVGGSLKETDGRAPYPGNYWYSFPNTCPLQSWTGGNKTDDCRAKTRGGLCKFDTLPDGVTCTYNYRILGYLPIDDLVGITAMKGTDGNLYQNFTMFCKDKGVEFNATEDGKWYGGLDFWKNPQDVAANIQRTSDMVAAYNKLVGGGSSSQIAADIVKNMQPLPTVDALTAQNPACYENKPSCGTGCMRANYSQWCVPCKKGDTGCQVAPDSFKYPTLIKAVGENGKTGSGSISTDAPSKTTVAPAPTPSPKSAAALTSAAATLTTALAFAASFFMN